MPVTLSERLRRRIALEGPISFRDFMEAALYDPEEGYYSRGARIGEAGDFATSPSISPLFARAVARQFRRGTAELDGPIDFVDAGAGSGELLAELHAALAKEDPAFAARLRLTAIEKSRAAREALHRRGLPPGLRVLSGAEELAPASVSGWIFSNELYDALPVARVRSTPAGLEEMRVGADPGGFGWVFAPASEELHRHFEAQQVTLEPGQVAEVSPEAPELHRTLARALAHGSLVAFDYGHRARTLYHSLARPNGTLAVHSAGRRAGNPLENPGEVDLTAHVNWDELARAGEAEGLKTVEVVRQGAWLTRAGIFDLAGSEAEKWRAFRLVDPEGMGDQLSVLVQTRSERGATSLTHSNPPIESGFE